MKDDYTKVDEIPFDFTRRRMSVVIEDRQGKRQIITKGAVEEILDVCSYAEFDGEIHPLTDSLKIKAQKISEEMNRQGMRVLAVSQKSFIEKDCNFAIEDEKEMVLIGYLAFLDPPKPSAAEAIEQLYMHGVAVKILSGDNDTVVKAIARQVGIDTGHSLTGIEMEEMDETTLKEAVKDTTLFSKLTPLQKTQIISLLQEQGNTVGFLGDGINDAGALRQSDIGISVDSAVDIAKEIKQRIRQELHLVASAGISYNKFLAKIASDYRKPDGLCTIHPDQADEFIRRLPIEAFWGVGPITAKKMHTLGIYNGETLRKCSLEMLQRQFGKNGLIYFNFARGMDDRPVEAVRIRKSIGCEHTLEKDLSAEMSLIIELYHVAHELTDRLKAKNFKGNTLTLKVKFDNFSQITRSVSVERPLQRLDDILPLAKRLLKGVDYSQHPIRLLGLSVSNPKEENGMNEHVSSGPVQLELEFKDDYI